MTKAELIAPMEQRLERYENVYHPIKSGHPTCPCCGNELDDGDSNGFSCVAGDCAERTVYGYCDTCDQEYSWNEVFVYAGYSNLQKD